MVLPLVVLSLMGDVLPSPILFPPTKPKGPVQAPGCRVNADCRLSTFQGCCPGCCPAPPHAVPVGTREDARCAVVECARPRCEAVRCAGVTLSAWEAVCADRQCIARPRASECRSDADCRLVEAPPPGCRAPCGCCAVSQALPVDVAVPLQQRMAAPPKGDGAPPRFGLSTGSQATQCPPCPPPAPVRAGCEAGRCVLQPVALPRPAPPPPG